MAWRIEIGEAAKKQLAALDRTAARRILTFLRKRVAELEDPRQLGRQLKGSKLGQLWRYRVGDYRVIASVEDDALVLLVVRIGTVARFIDEAIGMRGLTQRGCVREAVSEKIAG